jgi:hypothetical protein
MYFLNRFYKAAEKDIDESLWPIVVKFKEVSSGQKYQERTIKKLTKLAKEDTNFYLIVKESKKSEVGDQNSDLVKSH